MYNRSPVAILAPFALILLSLGPVVLGTPDATLTRLFTPRSVPSGTYVVHLSADSIEALTSRLRALDPTPSPGAWEPSRPEASNAFGQDGVYDRVRLARLFTGKRVTVVRGSLVLDGRRVAYTLISPYPNAALSAIEPGTMVVEQRVGRL